MRIAHVALYVTDLERENTFFQQYFGAQSNSLYHNSGTGFSSYFMTFGGEATLELMHRPETTAEKHAPYMAGFAHISLSLGSREAVDSLTEKLRTAGVVITGEPRTTGDGYYESVILDPEGNPIELTE